MIKFKPKTDINFNGENALGYLALGDDDSVLGQVIFQLEGYSMKIFDIDAENNDAEIIEGLIRSALGYGGTRNVYGAFYCADKGKDVALSLGFEPEEDKLYGEIPFLLKGSCCKN